MSTENKQENIAQIPRLLGIIALLYFISSFALNPEQKKAAAELHRGKCRYPGCQKDYRSVHIHHIIPQAFAKLLGMSPDHITNLVPICQTDHLGPATSTQGQEEENGFGPIHPESMRRLWPRLLRNNTKALNDRVFWMTRHDAEMQIAAITDFLQENKTSGWRFPLRYFSLFYRGRTGGYAWDTMVAILVENYVLDMAGKVELNQIFAKMKNSNQPSWKIYYESIYEPAVSSYQQGKYKVEEIIQRYLNSLTADKYKQIVTIYNKANKSGDRTAILEALIEHFYNPAKTYNESHPINSLQLKIKKLFADP